MNKLKIYSKEYIYYSNHMNKKILNPCSKARFITKVIVKIIKTKLLNIHKIKVIISF